jgi:phosphonate transport system ATP-binding protein
MHLLEINNLKKTFEGGTEALRGVNLKIKKGEFLSILGPSGSGKTTLMRSVNGLENIESGNIFFDNKKINEINLPEVQKKTGMIFQDFNLVNNLSAINNVLTGLLNSSSKFLSMLYLFTKEQKLEALKALETVGLLNKAYNRVDELSGGQRQRVGIARAIIKKPLLLLADEPVASLDPTAANLVMSLLKKINKEFNITVICNLHQVDLAAKYSDRIVGLLDGEIKLDQPSSKIDKININQIYR